MDYLKLFTKRISHFLWKIRFKWNWLKIKYVVVDEIKDNLDKKNLMSKMPKNGQSFCYMLSKCMIQTIFTVAPSTIRVNNDVFFRSHKSFRNQCFNYNSFRNLFRRHWPQIIPQPQLFYQHISILRLRNELCNNNCGEGCDCEMYCDQCCGCEIGCEMNCSRVFGLDILCLFQNLDRNSFHNIFRNYNVDHNTFPNHNIIHNTFCNCEIKIGW